MKISRLIDYIITFSFIYIIAFVWCRMFIHNIFALFITSSIITLTLSIIIIKMTNKHYIKIDKKNYKTMQINQLKNELLTNTQKENVLYFSKILKEHFNVLPRTNYLIMNKTIMIIPIFNSKKINENDILRTFVKYKSNYYHIVFLCIDYENNSLETLKLQSLYFVEILNLNEIISEIYVPFNIKLPKVITNKNNKNKLKNLKNNMFKREKSKKYAILGVFFFISTIFFRYNYFYIIFTTINFILSLICFCNVNIKTKKQKSIFQKDAVTDANTI